MKIVYAFIILILLYFLYQALPDTNPVKHVVSNMLTRANRNNNPGNLKYAGQAGAVKADADGFAVFDSQESGWNALINQIQLDQNRGLTLSQFIAKYAPPTENDTNNYLQYVSDYTNSNPGDSLSDIDSNVIAQAIANFEGYHTVKGGG